jgi:hypothetical protein
MKSESRILTVRSRDYDTMLDRVVRLIDEARRASARSVNAIMSATYWSIGRHIVEFELKGKKRAEYGEELLERVSVDLTSRFGRGFSRPNLQQMRQFYQAFPVQQICQTLSDKLLLAGKIQTASGKSPAQRREKSQTVSDRLSLDDLVACFPLPWSAYVRLLSVKNEQARKFYEAEALRGGWSVRQLDRKINSLFHERTALSRNKAKMLSKGALAKRENAISPEEEIKDPYVLEFLGLKDEYSESEIEEALVLLCSQKDEAIARYALDGLPNKILATEYRTVLPDEQLIADEIEKTRHQLEAHPKSR